MTFWMLVQVTNGGDDDPNDDMFCNRKPRNAWYTKAQSLDWPGAGQQWASTHPSAIAGGLPTGELVPVLRAESLGERNWVPVHFGLGHPIFILPGYRFLLQISNLQLPKSFRSFGGTHSLSWKTSPQWDRDLHSAQIFVYFWVAKSSITAIPVITSTYFNKKQLRNNCKIPFVDILFTFGPINQSNWSSDWLSWRKPRVPRRYGKRRFGKNWRWPKTGRSEFCRIFHMFYSSKNLEPGDCLEHWRTKIEATVGACLLSISQDQLLLSNWSNEGWCHCVIDLIQKHICGADDQKLWACSILVTVLYLIEALWKIVGVCSYIYKLYDLYGCVLIETYIETISVIAQVFCFTNK